MLRRRTAQEREREQRAVPGVIRLHNADTEVIELVRQLQLRREAELERLNRCTLPDRTSRGVDTTVVFNGWTYRRVEVLVSQFERIGAGWIRLPESEQDRPTR
jgi:hypothetical protein